MQKTNKLYYPTRTKLKNLLAEHPEGVVVQVSRGSKNHYLVFAECINPDEKVNSKLQFIVCDSAAYLPANGDFVLDKNGQRIVLQKEPGTNNFDTSNLKNQIGLFTFNNPNYLTPVANNLYAVSVKSGEAVAVENNEGYLIQGALEQSGTNLADEMAEMITVQRAFQLAARVVSTAEENQRTINELRR